MRVRVCNMSLFFLSFVYRVSTEITFLLSVGRQELENLYVALPLSSKLLTPFRNDNDRYLQDQVAWCQ